jgi:hypothetical protein
MIFYFCSMVFFPCKERKSSKFATLCQIMFIDFPSVVECLSDPTRVSLLDA